MVKRITVRIVVDDDVKKKHSVKSVNKIYEDVLIYLNDPDGWSTKGFIFETVLKDENVLIRLSSPSTITRICGLAGNLSCAELGGKNMFLNSNRWFHGAPKSKLDLVNYRQYMVSHEIGHILGFEHSACPCVGCKAPIMMQQTLGIGKCNPNTKLNS